MGRTESDTHENLDDVDEATLDDCVRLPYKMSTAKSPEVDQGNEFDVDLWSDGEPTSHGHFDGEAVAVEYAVDLADEHDVPIIEEVVIPVGNALCRSQFEG